MSALKWDNDGRDWPNRAASRFVSADGLRWHVQVMGAGPVLLLLHGTGASTHSWRGLGALLARRFTIVAPDLPGHAFTQTPARDGLALPAMARGVTQLLKALKLTPEFAVGHSAGAAIALRMVLDGDIAPRGVVSINGALLPFPGLAAVAFPAMARALFLNPFAAPFITRMARDPAAIERLIRGTGSKLDTAGYGFYRRLMTSEPHVAATIGMMARWDLEPLKREFARLNVPLTLLAATGDKAVPPGVANEVAALTRLARVEMLQELGHLAHEEAPETVATLIERACLPAQAAAPRKRKAG